MNGPSTLVDMNDVVLRYPWPSLATKLLIETLFGLRRKRASGFSHKLIVVGIDDENILKMRRADSCRE